MRLREKDEIVDKKNVNSVKRDFWEEKFFFGTGSHERVPHSWAIQKRLKKEKAGNSALDGRGLWSNWQVPGP